MCREGADLVLVGSGGCFVSGGWNGCVFGGKCWWVLAKAPSGDKFALQSVRKTRYRARFSRLGRVFLRKVGKGIHRRIRGNLPENNRYSLEVREHYGYHPRYPDISKLLPSDKIHLVFAS